MSKKPPVPAKKPPQTKPVDREQPPSRWPSLLGHAAFVLMTAFLLSAMVYTTGVSGAAWSARAFILVIVIMLICGALISVVGKLAVLWWRALIVWGATVIVYIIIVAWSIATDTGGDTHPAIGWFTSEFWTEFHMVLWWALISLLPFAVGVVAVWLIRSRRAKPARLPSR